MNNVVSIASPMKLLELAVQTGAGFEQLAQIQDMYYKHQDREVRREFFAALSEFQAKCPNILKASTASVRSKKGEGSSYSFKYAKLSDITAAIRDLEHECGLTHRWEINDTDNGLIEVTCVITHTEGHSERTTMHGAPDDSGGKNKVQERASTVSYLQRYTLIGALGISTADEDTDGGRPKLTVEDWFRYNLTVQEHWTSINAIKEALAVGEFDAAAEAMAEIGPRVTDTNMSTNPRAVLARSATKGGVFTVEEMKQLRSPEFAEAIRKYDADQTREVADA